MADVIDELVVKITGDASDLERTINGVASELSKLEQVQGRSNGAAASGSKRVDAYKKSMQEAQTTLQTSRAALANTKKAYEDNEKFINKNVSALKTQKTELDKQISLRSNEKRLLTEANKHLDKNSVAYKDNQKALQWINTEIGTYTEQSKKISDSIRTQETALAGSKKAYTDAQATVQKATQQYKEYESGLKAVERAAKAQNLQETGKQWKEVGEGIDTVTKPAQYAAIALAAGGVASAKFAIDFEDSFANVKKTVDGTPEQLDAIKKSIIDMSTVGINGHNAIPMTTDKLNELAAAGGQLGITVDNIADFTEVMAQMETATNLAGEEGAATLARFQNVMGITQGEIRNVGSTIVDLGNNSATTEAEIAAMALRMGKYGQTVGMSAADVLGYSAALSSLGIEAQMGGSAVGRTWLSIETAVANGGEALNAFAKYSGKSAKKFKEQWNTDSKGAFNGLLKGLQSADNLTIALQNIGVENTQDIQAMMALVNGYDLVTKSVDRANTAYKENTALQEEFDRKAETTASQLAVTKQNFIETARSIGETMLPTIKDVSIGAADFAKGLASMDDGTKKFLVSAGATVIGLGALSKGTAGAIKGIGGIVEGVGKIKKAMDAGGLLAKFAPALTAIGSAAGPAAIGIAAVGTATVGMYAAARAYEEYRADWSRGGEEMASALRSHVESVRELNDLQYELRNLQQVVNNPATDETTLNTSKARIQEIKQLLSEKYNLDITVNDSELDAAIEKAKELQLLETKQQIPDLLDYADSEKDDYNQALKDQGLYYSNIEGIKQQQEATKNFRNELLLLDDAYKKGNISQEEYTNTFNKLIEATGNPNFRDMPLDVLLNSDEIDNWSKRLEENLTNNNQLLAESESKTAEFTQAMQDLANAGLLELEFGDAEQGLSHIATAVKSANLSTVDWATTVALVQNGFSTIQDAIKAGGLDTISQQANEFAHSFDLIPKDKHIEISADGNISIIDNAKEKVENLPEEHDTDITATDNTGPGVDSAQNQLSKLPESKEINITTVFTTKFQTSGDSLYNKFTNGNQFGAIPKAKGDSNFVGGNALLNDDGSSDPRELIIHDGLAYMYNEPNVIANVPQHATILTSSQTKAKLRQMGITSYASGKNNSDAFTSARDDWTHYTKTHSVTTAQELEKWLEFQEQYKENEKDIWDIEEQIFSLQTKLYSERVKESENWLRHEEKYNGMGVDDYIAGIDRMKAYTADYYAQGIINYKEYTEALNDLDEKRLDKVKEGLSKQFDASKAYISEHTYFNDWQDSGDDPLDAYNRVMDRHREALANGELTQEEYDEYEKALGSDMYSERKEQSLNWLEEQREYFGISDKEYTEGLERIKAYTQEYYDKGLISRREYNEAMTDINHSAWDEAESAYEDMLAQRQEYISDLQEEFSKQEQALRDSWEVADRAVDMADVQNQLDIYKNAVTDRGQQKYQELQDQMKQLQRDEELYNLQVANNATIEQLQADYEQAEDMKADVLKGIAQANIDISGIVGSMTANIQNTGSNITDLLSQLLQKFDNLKVESNSMTDNRKIVNNISQLTPEQLQELVNNAVKL